MEAPRVDSFASDPAPAPGVPVAATEARPIARAFEPDDGTPTTDDDPTAAPSAVSPSPAPPRVAPRRSREDPRGGVGPLGVGPLGADRPGPGAAAPAPAPPLRRLPRRRRLRRASSFVAPESARAAAAPPSSALPAASDAALPAPGRAAPAGPPPAVPPRDPAPAATRYPRDPHARWRAIQTDPDPFVREMLERLRRAESVEPYHQVGDNWRRAPWEPNPYEHIGPGFVVARDMPAPDSDALTAKLRTTLPPGWMDLPPPPPSGAAATTTAQPPPPDETPCLVCGRTDDEAAFVLCDGCPRGALPVPRHGRRARGRLVLRGCPGAPEGRRMSRRRNGREPGSSAAAPPPPPPPPPPAPPPPAPPRWRDRTPLRLGVDVEERPMWGMDCYTRVAIDAALGRAKAFAGSDAAARDRREVFFQKLLMPAVHTMGADGWDLAAAVRKVRSNALHPPRETSSSSSGRPRSRESVEAVVGGCDAILRAIEEVDEAGLETTPPPRPAKGSGARGVPERTGGKKKNGGGREPLDSNAPGFIPPGLNVKCKKPLGPYMIFAGEARGAILAETPSLTLPETAKALGRRWKALAPEERARYEALAKAAKARYEEVDLPAAIQAALDGEVAAAKAERRRRRRRSEGTGRRGGEGGGEAGRQQATRGARAATGGRTIGGPGGGGPGVVV